MTLEASKDMAAERRIREHSMCTLRGRNVPLRARERMSKLELRIYMPS